MHSWSNSWSPSLQSLVAFWPTCHAKLAHSALFILLLPQQTTIHQPFYEYLCWINTYSVIEIITRHWQLVSGYAVFWLLYHDINRLSSHWPWPSIILLYLCTLAPVLTVSISIISVARPSDDEGVHQLWRHSLCRARRWWLTRSQRCDWSRRWTI